MPKAVRRVLLAGLVSFVVYPLSYAPVDFFVFGPANRSGLIYMKRLPVFAPVEFLIDRSVLSSSLLLWSDLWRVGSRHRLECWLRQSGYSGAAHGSSGD